MAIGQWYDWNGIDAIYAKVSIMGTFYPPVC